MAWTIGQRVTVLDGDRPIAIRTVDRVTPTGMPVVGAIVYAVDGSGRGDLRHRTLRPATEEDLLLPAQWKAARDLRVLRASVDAALDEYRDLTEDQCRAVLAILGVAP